MDSSLHANFELKPGNNICADVQKETKKRKENLACKGHDFTSRPKAEHRN